MLGGLFGRNRAARIGPAVYGAIVTESRNPALYKALAVPDTVSGRFEMVVLHLFLVLHRLRDGGPEEAAVGQSMFDFFCTQMDRSLREMGVGDLGVAKRMRQVGEAFYGRTQVYHGCVERHDEAGLADALARNVFKDPGKRDVALPLARYALGAADRFANTPPPALVSENLSFPDPAAFASAAPEAVT